MDVKEKGKANRNMYYCKQSPAEVYWGEKVAQMAA